LNKLPLSVSKQPRLSKRDGDYSDVIGRKREAGQGGPEDFPTLTVQIKGANSKTTSGSGLASFRVFFILTSSRCARMLMVRVCCVCVAWCAVREVQCVVVTCVDVYC